jgi:hypothetical protein
VGKRSDKLMLCYKDRAFCASPNCTGECGRKLTDEIRGGAARTGMPLQTAYFCDIPDDLDKNENKGERSG